MSKQLASQVKVKTSKEPNHRVGPLRASIGHLRAAVVMIVVERIEVVIEVVAAAVVAMTVVTTEDRETTAANSR